MCLVNDHIHTGIIEYVHTSPSKGAYNDRFDFNVVALGVTKEASFKITVYPSTFWTPMQLKAGGGTYHQRIYVRNALT